MPATIKDWFGNDGEPSNAYELLGKPLFAPDRAELLVSIRTAVREVMALQNHRDARVSDRAIRLQNELGRAEAVFGNANRRHEYDNQLLSQLRKQFCESATHGADRNPVEIRNWLETQQRIHPNRLLAVVQALSSAEQETVVFDDSVDEKPTEAAETNDSTAGTQVDPQAGKNRRAKRLSKVFGDANNQRKRKSAISVPTPQNQRPATTPPIPPRPSVQSGRDEKNNSVQPMSPQYNEPVRFAGASPSRVGTTSSPGPIGLTSDAGMPRPLLYAIVCGAGVVLLVILAIVAMSLAGRISSPIATGPQDEPFLDVVAPKPKPPSDDPAPTVPDEVKDSRDRLPVPDPGTAVELTGTVQRIHGWHYKPTVGDLISEVHVVVKLDDRLGDDVDFVDAYAQDAALAREVLDYVTAEDAKETGAVADQVQLAGTVVTARTPLFRYHRTSPAVMVELRWLQRVDKPDSRAEVGGTVRDEASLREPLDRYKLLGLVRFHPQRLENVSFAGTFRRYDPKKKLILIVPNDRPQSDNGVEVSCASQDFTDFRDGDTVEVVGLGTGILYTDTGRPLIAATGVVRPGVVNPDIGKLPRVPVVQPRPNLNRKHPGTDLLVVAEDGAAAVQSAGQWHELDFSDKSPSKIIWVHTDHAGRVWLAGETNGQGAVTLLTGNSRLSYTTANGLPSKPIAHVFEDSNDGIWVSSWDAGIAKYATSRWRTFTENDGLRHLTSNGCAEAADGRIWISGGTFGPVTRSISTYYQGSLESGGPAALLQMTVMSIDGDSKGNIYLGYIGGLLIVHPDSSLTNITVEQGLPQRTPQATFVDSQGRIWLGTWGGGVARVDQSTFELVKGSVFAEPQYVRRITEDANGAIWVASQNGLWKYASGQWSGPIQTPLGSDKINVVATVPTKVAQQLVGWAKPIDPVDPMPPVAAAEEDPGNPLIPAPTSPLKCRPRSPQPRLRLLSSAASTLVDINLRDGRDRVIGAMGAPLLTQEIEFEKLSNKTADIYITQGESGVAHMSLIVYSSSGKAEYLDLAKIRKRSTADAAVSISMIALRSLMNAYYDKAK